MNSSLERAHAHFKARQDGGHCRESVSRGVSGGGGCSLPRVTVVSERWEFCGSVL